MSTRRTHHPVTGVFSAPRLGVEVKRREVSAVLVRGAHIERSISISVQNDATTQSALVEVFSVMCSGIRRKPRVFAAVAPSAAQLRRVVGLPVVDDPRRLREILRSNPARFFLRNGTSIVTSGVRLERAGEGWAAALEEPVLRDLVNACASLRLRLVQVVPTLAALPLALVGEVVVAADEDVVATALLDEAGALRTVQYSHRPFVDAAEQKCLPSQALAALGAEALRYAGAFAATQAAASEPLGLQPRDLGPRDVPVPRWRLVLAATALITAIAIAVLLPPLYATQLAARAREKLLSIDRTYRAARWTEQELMRTTTALQQIDDLSRRRRAVTAFLAELTEAVPDDAWLTSVQLDSVGGTVVALAPRANSVLEAIAGMRDVTVPNITGVVSPEQSGQSRVERAVIRFRWRSRADSANAAKVVSGRQR